MVFSFYRNVIASSPIPACPLYLVNRKLLLFPVQDFPLPLAAWQQMSLAVMSSICKYLICKRFLQLRCFCSPSASWMAWLPLSQPQYVLQCSQPESFGNVFISKSELPSKNRQSSCTCCLSIGTQNRCEHTTWVGMQNLCYCKSWHYEHHLLMTFRYGLMWRIQSHRLQTRHFRKATLFSSLRLFLPCGTLSGKAKQGHQPSHCSTAHYCSLRQHLSINTLPNTSSLSAYLWLSAIQQQGTSYPFFNAVL